MSYQTQGVVTIIRNGELYRQVSLCQFLQDLTLKIWILDN